MLQSIFELQSHLKHSKFKLELWGFHFKCIKKVGILYPLGPRSNIGGVILSLQGFLRGWCDRCEVIYYYNFLHIVSPERSLWMTLRGVDLLTGRMQEMVLETESVCILCVCTLCVYMCAHSCTLLGGRIGY